MIIDRRPARAVRLYHPIRVARARALIAQREPWFKGESPDLPSDTSLDEISLISSLVERSPGVQVLEEDILAPRVDGPFDLIRAANILNAGYFSRERLRQLVAALLLRLADQGLFYVIRTAGTVNHGTLWKRAAGKLTVVGRVGNGSEIADIVEAQSLSNERA